MADTPVLSQAASRAEGVWTLLDRMDAVLVSFAAKFWSELVVAFALAGQCAGGVRCFPPDLLHADESANRPPDTEQARHAAFHDKD